MPELPEVETVARRLRIGELRAGYTTRESQPTGLSDAPQTGAAPAGTGLIGWRVSEVNLLWDRTLDRPSPEELSRRLVGQTLRSVSRRAKYIVMTFAPSTLLIHLRMSGDLRVEPVSAPLLPHDRAWVSFDLPGEPAGMRVAFHDPRKFGRLWLVDDPQEVLSELGPEPLEPGFTPEFLYRRLHASTRQIKPLLLDQSFLAGLGNIYTDESLHKAKIHPLTPADQVTETQAAALWAAIRDVLEEGIRRNGASIDWVYRGGEFQNQFRAYQRTGEPCPVCGTPIQRMVVGQRGTHFCPNCQPFPA